MVKIYYSFIQKNQKESFVKYVTNLFGKCDNVPQEDNFCLGENYFSVSFSGDIIMVAVANEKSIMSLQKVVDIDYKQECLNFCTEKEISKMSNLQGYYILLTKKQSMAKYLGVKIIDVTFEDEIYSKGQKVEINSISSLFDEYIFSIATTKQEYEKILIM